MSFYFARNVLPSLSLTEVWKSVSIWQNYRQK